MISQKQATRVAAAGKSSTLRSAAVRPGPSVRVRVSTEDVQTEAPPKVDFTPNTQAVSGQQLGEGDRAKGLEAVSGQQLGDTVEISRDPQHIILHLLQFQVQT